MVADVEIFISMSVIKIVLCLQHLDRSGVSFMYPIMKNRLQVKYKNFEPASQRMTSMSYSMTMQILEMRWDAHKFRNEMTRQGYV